tara:strand:- start:766 stop:1266 length:501 start_codon:yes stop_codon:yes gene_type:complete
MKSVILFRHGKSDWGANYNHDHDRPLSKRGVRDAKKMGKFLSKKVEVPDLVISSTALRTRDTIELAVKSGGWSTIIKYEKSIYGASLEKLLNILKEQNNKYQCICLVGHEPILSSFIEKVKGQSIIKFPTGAIGKVSFDTKKWNEINLTSYKCELKWFFKPKEIDQ